MFIRIFVVKMRKSNNKKSISLLFRRSRLVQYLRRPQKHTWMSTSATRCACCRPQVAVFLGLILSHLGRGVSHTHAPALVSAVALSQACNFPRLRIAKSQSAFAKYVGCSGNGGSAEIMLRTTCLHTLRYSRLLITHDADSKQ